MKSICWCLLLAAGAVTGLSGETFRTDINPALRYYQAYILAPDFSQADRDYLFTNEWRGQKLPPRFGELMERYNHEFTYVRQAAHATVACDWGVDMSAGPATLLPHLARNKGIAQAARLRVLWHLQQGRAMEARDDLLAAFTLGRNSARDKTLISVLVQIAIENLLCCSVAENFYRFSPQTLVQLVDGFEAAPSRCTMASAIAMEKTCYIDWLVRRVRELQKVNAGNEARTMAAIRELFAGLEDPNEGQNNQAQPSLWERVTKAAGGTSDGILKLFQDDEPIYQRLALIMAQPHSAYENQIKQFNADIQHSVNPLVSQTIPALVKARTREFAILVELAMLRAGVEYKLHGESALKSVMDPCGQGPFALERFVFEGIDRGIELKSAYHGRGFPEVLILVEKDGPPFYINGQHAGQALPK